MKKYLIFILLILLIYGCKQDLSKKQVIEKRGQLIVDISPASKTKGTEQQIQKYKSEKECKDYWNKYLSTNIFILKPRLFVKFSQDTDFKQAKNILKTYSLEGKPFNVFYEVMPDKKPSDEIKIYDAGHQMSVNVKKNKEIETLCKLEKLNNIIEIYPDLTFNFQIKK